MTLGLIKSTNNSKFQIFNDLQRLYFATSALLIAFLIGVDLLKVYSVGLMGLELIGVLVRALSPGKEPWPQCGALMNGY